MGFTLQQAIGSRKIEGIDTSKIEYMQFTGLKDTKGKEIYEGDIVEWDWNFAGSILKETAVIESLNEAYQFEGSEETETWIVIGNIYENPELLK